MFRASRVLLPAILAAMLILCFDSSTVATNVDGLSDIAASPPCYEANLKVYVVEPVSRWDDWHHNPYEFGFLDWPIDSHILVPYRSTFRDSALWHGSAVGFGEVTEENLMVIAVLFNAEAHDGFSWPSEQLFPFTAYYVDAAAAAYPGQTGIDSAFGNYTHTVFLEEATIGT